MKRLLLGLALAAASAAADPCETLAPSIRRDLPRPTFARIGGISWLNGGKVLIGAASGINEYDLADGSARRVVSGSAIPYGIPDVSSLGGDGRRLFAFSFDYSDLAYDLADHKILQARRHAAFQICDVAVHGETVAVLGRPVLQKNVDFGSLWVGPIGAPWSDFRGFHSLSGDAETIFRGAFAPYGGGVVIQKDGTIAAITPAEAGVFRFSPDGSQLPTLGQGLTDLVVKRLPEVGPKFGTDVAGRYEQIFNRQPTIDDLVETSDGLAIVVRRATRDGVTWELWFPSEQRTRRVVRLGIREDTPLGGHLHCDTRGSKIACVSDHSTGLYKPAIPYVVLFDLKQAKRSASCS